MELNEDLTKEAVDPNATTAPYGVGANDQLQPLSTLPESEDFSAYFAKELASADAVRAETLGKDYKDTRKIWDSEELKAMRDPRTGKPFNILGLDKTDPDYVGNYISNMNIRVNHPFTFWNKIMHENIPVEEIEYLTALGVLLPSDVAKDPNDDKDNE